MIHSSFRRPRQTGHFYFGGIRPRLLFAFQNAVVKETEEKTFFWAGLLEASRIIYIFYDDFYDSPQKNRQTAKHRNVGWEY
jgi:hypothetical protein